MLYKNSKTRKISFPLGGIGTGCIGLAGNGELVDWEILNRPNKNTFNGYSHFALKVKRGDKYLAKILHGDLTRDLSGDTEQFGFGPSVGYMAGFPHFKNVSFKSDFPIANLTFSEQDFPIKARLCAFNPLIPHDDFNSSLPAAFFEWELENIGGEQLECELCLSVRNLSKKSLNEVAEISGFNGLFFADGEHTMGQIDYRDLCILTDCENFTIQRYWYRGGWMDSCTTFWRDFTTCDRLPERAYDDCGQYDHGSLSAHVELAPHAKSRVRFVICWNAPTCHNYWLACKDENGNDRTWKNYYATLFENSLKTAEYAMLHFSELLGKTKRFARAIAKSTLPPSVSDAVSANLSVLKSPTVLRLEDGSIWGWEGCGRMQGSCWGSCQHVWNYAYALPFLFPKLERSLRENTLKYALKEDGSTAFRIQLPLGYNVSDFRPCVDGHMGEIIKIWREWKISGDDEWLLSRSDDVFKMLEYAWSDKNADKWDIDMDGVIEGRQHHTLDVELFGANSWLEGFYLLALDCGAQIADKANEPQKAKLYRELYARGKKYLNDELFNGEYYGQIINLKDKSVLERFDANGYWNDEAQEIKYQIGEGCIIDQMLADWHAAVLGLNEVFDKDKKRVALKNLYKNNFKTNLREVANPWRTFALNDEAGTLICTYPDKSKTPAMPIPYCEECMTGFEYAFAGLLLANGFEKEGLTAVNAVRARYDGEKRNPWNEIECGSNYARSMASFALLNIYSGFRFDMTRGFIGFYPILSGDGAFLWSVAEAWGTISFSKKSIKLRVLGGKIELREFGTPNAAQVKLVRADKNKLDFSCENQVVRFKNTLIYSELILCKEN